MIAKLRGNAPACHWGEVLTSWWQNAALARATGELEDRSRVRDQDYALGIELVQSPERAFWIKKGDGQAWKGERLLSYLLAEHAWMERQSRNHTNRPGDIVLDCEAHVGVFVHNALKRGAARVVAIEPEPVNVEC